MKKAVVIGYGISGRSAAILLKKQGYEVYIYDDLTVIQKDNGERETQSNSMPIEQSADNPISVDLPSVFDSLNDCSKAYVTDDKGRLSPIGDYKFDLAIVSPGMSPSHSIFKCFIAKETVGELEYAMRYTSGRKVLVTGSNGKTTAVTLIGDILKINGMCSYVVGNIGIPVSDIAGSTYPDEIIVVEISSFQAENSSIDCDISVLLNISPDHTDRHGSMEKYVDAKLCIMRHCKCAILGCNFINDDIKTEITRINPDTRIIQIESNSVKSDKTYVASSSIKNQALGYSLPSLNAYSACLKAESSYIPSSDTMQIVYDCGVLEYTEYETAACAVEVCKLLGVPLSTITQGLAAFRGLAHRRQKVAQYESISFINDSKATNTDSTFKLIEQYSSPYCLIMGGYESGFCYNDIIRKLKEVGSCAVFFGENAENLANCAKRLHYSDYVTVKTMEECVKQAFKYAKKLNGNVLFSPGAKSFDMFKNYKERGECYIMAVNSFIECSDQKG
ncbi:MAG: UDP-N-acetylmuramoyl-L-alanine--D-glutamate ligase [Clostridia bacterium]|nr:UDP-N-acetylmuramoyl-L-alanine--D-glutamate ligase [Clostridia bacterium]